MKVLDVKGKRGDAKKWMLEATGKSSHLKSFPWALGCMAILLGADSKKEPKICLEPYYGYPAL